MATAPNTFSRPEVRRRKLALNSKLRELARTTHDREDLQIEHLADPLDQIRSNADRELAVQRVDQQARLIHEIQAALAGLEEGVYGVCQQCEEPISQKRLDAVPWATLCVKCQTRAEAEHHRETVFAHRA